ncbi:MAG TPA: hypothetical protein VMF52_01045 [Steroidobacteraceae bacterium]|nr:hypothetical protein [Steroidobacteraceae bacterium]
MVKKLFAALAAGGIVACATSNGPMTSWGKENVSMLDYQTDGILCATLAQNADGGNGANSAGGINGRNAGSGTGLPTQSTTQSGTNSNAAVPVGGGGVYREGASADFANRAAQQQRQAEMQRLKARNDAIHSCLAGRGYTEFRLTADERAKLATLPEGSEERRKFLYALATNPEVLKNASTR